MKPARFDYLRAGTLAEAHATLASEGEDARVLAGGQSLVPMLSMRMARPKVLVDIMHLPQLAKIENDGNTIRIGAGYGRRNFSHGPRSPNASHSWPPRCLGSGTRKPAAAGRSAARSPTQIRVPKFRSPCSHSKAQSTCRRGKGSGAFRLLISSPE